MKTGLTIILLLLVLRVAAQSSAADQAVATGNAFYRKQEFNRAAAEYAKALQADPANGTARFNQASTFYKQEQKVEAVQLFTALSREAVSADLKAKSFYNKGVILGQQKNTEESIEAYKQTLRLKPTDQQARENLQKALLELKKKTPPPPEPPKKQDKKKQNQQQQQQKQQQSKMSPKETEQRLRLLQQKEKEVQQRLQRERSRSGGSQPKDW